jgi:hypothetical protein
MVLSYLMYESTIFSEQQYQMYTTFSESGSLLYNVTISLSCEYTRYNPSNCLNWFNCDTKRKTDLKRRWTNNASGAHAETLDFTTFEFFFTRCIALISIEVKSRQIWKLLASKLVPRAVGRKLLLVLRPTSLQKLTNYSSHTVGGDFCWAKSFELFTFRKFTGLWSNSNSRLRKKTS